MLNNVGPGESYAYFYNKEFNSKVSLYKVYSLTFINLLLFLFLYIFLAKV